MVRLRAATVAKAVAYLAALAVWNRLLSSVFRPPAGPGAANAQPPIQAPDALPLLRAMYLRDVPRLGQSPPPPGQRGADRWASSCSAIRANTDLEGDVVQDGYGPRGLSLPPAACCAACGATRGCNVWVACADASRCGQQCWLKWAADPAGTSVRGAGSGVPWTAGVMPGKDTPGSVPEPPEAELAAVKVVALRTAFGDLLIRLRPDWHAPSVRYVRIVALTDSCTAKCVFYRAEPGFLLQGAMRAVVPPNNQTREKPAGTAMEIGHVAWAGGGAGPDLFITMSRVGGFGGSHTVWGEVTDRASLALADKLVNLPIEKGLKPGAMRMIDSPVPFTVHPAG